MTQTATARRGPKPNPHTRDNLLRAGVQTLHDSGFHGTGVQEIVAAAHVPKGSFYNHFASKEAFAAEVVDAYFADGLDDIRTILRDPHTAPIDRLRRYFHERGTRLGDRGYARGCLLGNLSLEVADHSDLIREHIAEQFDTWAGLFEECITAGQNDGTITRQLPANTLASFLLNSWEGALLRARSEKNSTPLDQFVQVVFDAVLRPAA